MIEILATGVLTSLQDAGRFGLRRVGVPWAGALVPDWMQIANALVGNASDHAVLEFIEAGLHLRIGERPVRIALAGDLSVESADGTRLAPWCSHTLAAGDTLRVKSTGGYRLGVLAIAGLHTTPCLGSVSTYARAGLGGLEGRALAAGDHLSVDTTPPTGPERRLPRDRIPGEEATHPILQAVAGPQDDAFEPAALDAFFADDGWHVGGDADRMGARLEGPVLAHRDPSARDIVSDAILPGSVQVPGGGQPIVMLADAHTVGGYPKIATVVSADLARLALARPGTRVRFVRSDVDAAVEYSRAAARSLARRLGAIERVHDRIDASRLFEENLVDGVIDARTDAPS